jgi:hypothetical protein
MARLKGPSETQKVVWRISSQAPQGEYIDPSMPRAEPVKAREPREYGWLASSLELLGGVGVSETPMDTLPGELIDEFFKR